MENTVTIRNLLPRDRGAIKSLLGKIYQFTDEEKSCAVELVDIYLGDGEDSKDYEFLVAADSVPMSRQSRDWDGNTLYGFICFGSISLAQGCYDLYWIVCDPALQNKGIGTRLLNRLGEILKARGVRKIFAETSSQENYITARNFYEKRGFRLIAKIPDFYKVGDDKLIYVKNLLDTN